MALWASAVSEEKHKNSRDGPFSRHRVEPEGCLLAESLKPASHRSDGSSDNAAYITSVPTDGLKASDLHKLQTPRVPGAPGASIEDLQKLQAQWSAHIAHVWGDLEVHLEQTAQRVNGRFEQLRMDLNDRISALELSVGGHSTSGADVDQGHLGILRAKLQEVQQQGADFRVAVEKRLVSLSRRLDTELRLVHEQVEKVVEDVKQTSVTSSLVSAFDTAMQEYQKEVNLSLEALSQQQQSIAQQVADDLALVAAGVETEDDLATKQHRSTAPRISRITLNEDHVTQLINTATSYSIRGNVWDAMILLNAPIDMGMIGNFTMILSVLVNMFVQLFICYYVIVLAIDQNGELSSDLVDDALLWKGQQTSALVERVCAQDFTLGSNSWQIEVYTRYDDYIEKSSSLLCTAMIIVWSLTVMREVNTVTHFIRAVSELPSGEETMLQLHLRRVHIITMGHASRRVVMLASVLQLFICAALLVAGAAWLSATETQEDLLLNSVALSYVMEVDELLYSIMSPAKVRAIMQQMTPLHYDLGALHGWCFLKFLRRLVQPILVFTFVVVVFWWRVYPRVRLMDDFIGAMC